MIEIQKNYVLTLTENQVRELYNLLQREKSLGHLTIDNDLKLVLNELSTIFNTGRI
jgi:uncharacterized protein YpuA (DUF1002 family)